MSEWLFYFNSSFKRTYMPVYNTIDCWKPRYYEKYLKCVKSIQVTNQQIWTAIIGVQANHYMEKKEKLQVFPKSVFEALIIAHESPEFNQINNTNELKSKTKWKKILNRIDFKLIDKRKIIISVELIVKSKPDNKRLWCIIHHVLKV